MFRLNREGWTVKLFSDGPLDSILLPIFERTVNLLPYRNVDERTNSPSERHHLGNLHAPLAGYVVRNHLIHAGEGIAEPLEDRPIVDSPPTKQKLALYRFDHRM
jgi:hypothetical protein